MPPKPPKTNAMRMLDRAGIAYRSVTYAVDPDDLTGMKVAAQIGLSPSQVYKTLVARGDRTGHLVCCLAVHQTADLKRLAAESRNKRVELIPIAELPAVTGYIRGGCSPIGMKKRFPTYLQADVMDLSLVAVSAGIRGCQILLAPTDLARATQATLCSIASDEERDSDRANLP